MARHTHGNPSLSLELQSHFADSISGYVVQGGVHDVSGTTSATLSACQAYIFQAGPPRRLRYVEETSGRGITYAAGNGVYWVVMSSTLTGAVGGWTRVTGTHYLYQLSATQPILPDKCILLLQVTVAGAAITEILDFRHRIIGVNTSETFTYTTSNRSEWVFLQGGKLTPATGVTVNHKGSIKAGLHQIFDISAGFIKFPQGATVQAEWWGAKADGVTESGAAIESALNAHTSNMAVELQEGTYIIEASINPPIGTNLDWSLTGKGMRKTTLQRASAFTGAIIYIGDGNANNKYIMQGFCVDGIDEPAGSVGIRVYRSGQGRFIEIRVRHCEHGIWFSGGSYHFVDASFIELNTSGITFDNTDNYAVTFTRVESTNFRHNQTAMDIDGSIGTAGLVRNIGLYRIGFENDQIATGTDIGIRIKRAEQVHMHECWFEDNSFHARIIGHSVADDDVALLDYHPCRFITFAGCNFGNHNGAAVDPEAIFFTGEGLSDGVGCYMDSCEIGEGEVRFDQGYRMRLQNLALVGSAELTGNQWYLVASNDTESETYSELNTKLVWRMKRVLKDDGVSVSRRYEIFTTSSTPDATIANLGTYTVPSGSGVYITVNAFARYSDNTAQAGYTVSGVFRNIAGTVTGVGTASNHTAIESTGGMDFIMDASGATVRFRGTGVAATVIYWALYITVIQSSLS